MQTKVVFEKYYSRMKKEGILNAGLIGLSAGGAISAVLSVVCMLVDASLALVLGLALGAGIAVFAGVTAALYFLKFRPTERKMAERADATGLQERSITMLELNGDDSYVARRQREDAAEHIALAEGSALAKLSVSVTAIVFACVLFLAGGAATTVSGLMAARVIPPIVAGESPLVPDGYAAVSYMADEGGEISGEEDQLVLLGESAEPVAAVPDEGWAFKEWSDGVTDPYRYDTAVNQDLTVIAIFEEVDEDGEGEDSDGEGKDSDDDNQKPNENQNNENKDPADEEQQPPPEDPDNPDNPDSKYEDKNQVIDGETYYRDVVGYYNAVMEKLTAGTGLTKEERDFIEKYFGSI